MNDEEDASGNSSITKKNEEAKSCLIQKITPNDIKGQIKSLITSTIARANFLRIMKADAGIQSAWKREGSFFYIWKKDERL